MQDAWSVSGLTAAFGRNIHFSPRSMGVDCACRGGMHLAGVSGCWWSAIFGAMARQWHEGRTFMHTSTPTHLSYLLTHKNISMRVL